MTIKVVSSQTHTDIEREQTFTDFKWAARELAANILRIVRGAGMAYEIPENIDNLYRAMERFREVHKAYPGQHHWNQVLHVNSAWFEIRPRWSEGNLNSILMDEGERLAFDQMIAKSGIRDGMLQMAASMLLHQIPQAARGEHEFYQGFRELIDLEQESRAYYDELFKKKNASELAMERLQKASEERRRTKAKAKKKATKPRVVK